MAKTRGQFITFEGLDGCGKSTQLTRLAEVLRGRGIEVVTTREPGGTQIGERVRAVLLDSRTQSLDPMAELALMFASRAQQIAEVIRPNVEAGRWVLCDRYTDSSEAYQGGGRQLGSETILDLHRVVCRGLQPELTVLMDSDVSASVARARRRNEQAKGGSADAADENRFEQESRSFYERVHEAYERIAARETQRVFKVDARPKQELVHSEIVAEVKRRFKV